MLAQAMRTSDDAAMKASLMKLVKADMVQETSARHALGVVLGLRCRHRR